MISEDKKAILMELVKAQEDELCEILHLIEEDQNVPDESYIYIENQFNRLFRINNLLNDEIYYSETI
jgi:hypothetical protein